MKEAREYYKIWKCPIGIMNNTYKTTIQFATDFSNTQNKDLLEKVERLEKELKESEELRFSQRNEIGNLNGTIEQQRAEIERLKDILKKEIQIKDDGVWRSPTDQEIKLLTNEETHER